jgi:hypothetical protein
MSVSLGLVIALSVRASVRGKRGKPGPRVRRVGDQPIPRRGPAWSYPRRVASLKGRAAPQRWLGQASRHRRAQSIAPDAAKAVWILLSGSGGNARRFPLFNVANHRR